MKRLLAAVLVAVGLAITFGATAPRAQANQTVMILWRNQQAGGTANSQFGGPLGPTVAGWEWRMTGWVVNRQNFTKGALECNVQTLDADNMATVTAKIIAGCQAAAAQQGFTVTAAVLEPLTVVTGL